MIDLRQCDACGSYCPNVAPTPAHACKHRVRCVPAGTDGACPKCAEVRERLRARRLGVRLPEPDAWDALTEAQRERVTRVLGHARQVETISAAEHDAAERRLGAKNA